MRKNTPRGVRVAPLRAQHIRQAADELRTILSVPPGRVDIVGLYEFELQSKGWDYDIVEDHLLPADVLAEAYPDRHLVRFKKTTWEKACQDDRMCRFTLAHELGHLMLHNSGRLGFARHSKQAIQVHEFYEDSEWQADKLAAELLMPAHEILASKMTASQIAFTYQVSYRAAEIRLKSLQDEGYLK
jgi:hypothetical protein